MRTSLRRAQRGITLVVVNAFNLSSTNLKSVGNMQVRDEAVAAANQAIEQLISAFSSASIATQTFTVDLNKDGTTDYTVSIPEAPKCIRRQTVGSCAAADCAVGTGECAQSYQGTSSSGGTTVACGTVIVDFDIKALVADANVSGARVVVREGIRIPVNALVADNWCS
jgi:hypothetical protein